MGAFIFLMAILGVFLGAFLIWLYTKSGKKWLASL